MTKNKIKRFFITYHWYGYGVRTINDIISITVNNIVHHSVSSESEQKTKGKINGMGNILYLCQKKLTKNGLTMPKKKLKIFFWVNTQKLRKLMLFLFCLFKNWRTENEQRND